MAHLGPVPQWTCVGYRPAFGPVHRVTLRGRDLVLYAPRDDLVLARDVCPHQGARLSNGRLRADGLMCGQHGTVVNMMSYPELHLDTVVSQGLVWVRDPPVDFVTWTGPPTQAEFDSPDYRTIEFHKTYRDSTVSVENILGFPALFDAAFDSYAVRTPTGGVATYTARTEAYDMIVVNEYVTPSTTTIRFVLSDKDTRASAPPLLLWFSVTPTKPGKVRLHTRVCVAASASADVTDWALDFASVAPLGPPASAPPTELARLFRQQLTASS